MKFPMISWRPFVLAGLLLTVLSGLASLFHPLQTTHADPKAMTLLYDSSLGSTPSQQNFSFQALNPQPPFTVQASQTYSPPVTVLDSASQPGDYAGYTISQTVMPALSQANGITLTFALRVISETHDSDDRAGFSLILLDKDLFGLEVAFWTDEIWVQEGNGALFEHAEGASSDPTAALTSYELVFSSDTYRLSADGLPLLSGSLRQYTDWEPPLMGIPDPYEQPNQLFLGDNTSSAGAEIWLGDISIQTGEDNTPAYALFLPSINKP